MKTLTPAQEQLNKRLIKRFYTLLSNVQNPSDAKAGILQSYRVTSTRDLSIDQLKEACDFLDQTVSAPPKALNESRKRLLAAIGGWYKAIGKVEAASNIDYIKATACRAAKKPAFNKIPLQQLINLYGLFCQKQRDNDTVEIIKAEEVDYLSIQN